MNFKVGRVVKYFTLADLTLWGGWGLLDPIFSVFIIERIVGATIATAGFSWALYWVLRSALQIPIANYLDKTPGENDDFRALITGLLILSFSSFCYLVISTVWQLYAIQVLRALGFALYAPSWLAIFSRHLDKERTAFDWTLDSTGAGLSVGVAAFVGGWVAGLWGFQALFILCGLLSMAAAVILLRAPSLLFPPKTSRRDGVSKPLR